MRRNIRIATSGTLGILAVATLAGLAGAGPQTRELTPQMLGAPTQKPAKSFALPAAPPLPQGCAAPTKEQCADSTFYASDACAKDPAKGKAVQAYCTWALQKAWTETAALERPALFPVTPPNVPDPILKPGRRIENGKEVAPTKLNRPSEKRRFGTGGVGNPAARGRSKGTRPGGIVNLNPQTMKSGGGSYGGLAAQSSVSRSGWVNDQLRELRKTNLIIDPAFKKSASFVAAELGNRPSFVSSPGAAVGSCEEYAYKRWGEWSDFAAAASKLGNNYRQIYNIATDPNSPFFINKSQLHQTGTADLIPAQTKDGRQTPYWFPSLPLSNDAAPSLETTVAAFPWWKFSANSELSLPANAFVSLEPFWLANPKATSLKGKALITDAEKTAVVNLRNSQMKSGSLRRVRAKNDTTPLAVHTEMKAVLDSKYQNPLDDELADAERRAAIYQDVWTRAASLSAELACLSDADLCFRCTQNPADGKRATLPSVFQKVTERVTGSPVINPNPADFGSVLMGGSAASRLKGLEALTGASGELKTFFQQSANAAANKAGGLKQKEPPQVSKTPANQCIAELLKKRPAVEEAYLAETQKLSMMLANELSFGDRGCLADPGTAIGNMCDWSYAKFAGWATNLFAEDAEKDFLRCRDEINLATQALPKQVMPQGAFKTILSQARNQALAFPCTQRRDFTASATEANWFFKINGSATARQCEANRANVAIKDQQQSILEQLAGINWKDGELFDASSDLNVLGDKDSLGAYFDYAANWKLKREGAPPQGDPMKTCAFEGGGGTKLRTGIYFFGDDLELFNMESQGTANSAPVVSMNARYFDIDSLTQKPVVEPVSNQAVPAGTDYVVPFVNPPINLGGVEYSFWMQVGPVPLNIKFGATATAGVDYRFSGKGGNNCADMTKPSGFGITSVLDPWVRADAYADASLDVLVASAGVRLDLQLLRLGLPLGVKVASAGKKYTFNNGLRLTVDMLSGRLTAYVELGVSPLAAEIDAEVFAWDGFHAETSLWGLDKTLDESVVRVAMAKTIKAEDATCTCAQNANFCCSQVSCAVPACQSESKTINGEKYICTYNKNDLKKIMAEAKTTMENECRWFVKP